MKQRRLFTLKIYYQNNDVTTMIKHLTLLLFIGLAWGQDDTGLEVITLKSGDVLKGEIVNASFKSVTLAKANGGEIIKISRKDIDNISTPFSRIIS